MVILVRPPLDFQRQDHALPGGHIQEQPARLQFIAIAVVDGVTELISQPPAATGQVREGEPEVTLALVGSIIHRDQQPLRTFTRVLPGEGHEAVGGPVAFPCGLAGEQLPQAIAHDRLAEHGEQPVVKRLQLRVDGFVRTATEVG